tara:strand:- start:2045 stop:2419 length:375 start_codon:yes stop_codon:yes gene_type:complete
MKTLYIIRGLPGSGKSTLAKRISKNHAEADMWMVDKNGDYKFDPSKLNECHESCQKMIEFFLKNGHSAVVSNTFTQCWEMQPYMDMAEKYGFDFCVIECRGNFRSIHNVPEKTIQLMRSRWEEY